MKNSKSVLTVLWLGIRIHKWTQWQKWIISPSIQKQYVKNELFDTGYLQHIITFQFCRANRGSFYVVMEFVHKTGSSKFSYFHDLSIFMIFLFPITSFYRSSFKKCQCIRKKYQIPASGLKKKHICTNSQWKQIRLNAIFCDQYLQFRSYNSNVPRQKTATSARQHVVLYFFLTVTPTSKLFLRTGVIHPVYTITKKNVCASALY